MVDPIEQLSACCGIANPRVTEKTIQDAFLLPERLAKRLSKWVGSSKTIAWKLPKQYDPDDLLNKLGTPAVFEDILPDVFDAQALDMRISEIRKALVMKYPVKSTADFLDDSILPPSDDEIQDWLALVSIADDESRILDEVEMGTLMPEQVSFYREHYPGLYQTLREVADAAIIDVNSSGKELTDDVESTLQIFLATGQADKPKAVSEDKPEAPKRQIDISAAGQQTARERTASK